MKASRCFLLSINRKFIISNSFVLSKKSTVLEKNEEYSSLSKVRKSLTIVPKNFLLPNRVKSVEVAPNIQNGIWSPKSSIDFENHRTAFKRKTLWEIIRALGILRLCAIDAIVNNSLTIMNYGEKILGRRLFRAIVYPVFYKQFVGGESPQEMSLSMRKLTDSGVRAMLAATMEEDLGQGRGEELYDSNCTRILECMNLASSEATCSPMMQIKLSGILSADLLVILGNIYTSTQDKLQLVRLVAEGLRTDNLKTNPFSTVLDEKWKDSFEKALVRLKRIGEKAEKCNVKVLVDAEFTYLNPGLSLLTLAMAAIYNQQLSLIWNTYQCYLKNAQRKLKEEMFLINNLNVHFGAKIVRGAYMVQEKARAQKLKQEDPVCKDYESTNSNYNQVLEILLHCVKKEHSKCEFITATHNEESIKLAIAKMETLKVDRLKGGVSFGQLYGMCDQISYPLANAGYAVYKSIPYGTLEEVLPYLARRAVENRSVLQGARKEQTLLWRELKYRLKRKIPLYSKN